LCEGASVLIDAHEILRLTGADDAAVPGIWCVDEDEIRLVDQTVLVGNQVEGRSAGRLAVCRRDSHGPERTHVQPDRRAPRAAVIEEGDGPPVAVDAVFGVRDVEDTRR
jgi:hypothetical protein